MSGLIEQLAEIRERAGHMPMPDPTRIDGAPMAWPQSSPNERQLEDPANPEWDEPAPEPRYPESPLIPRFDPKPTLPTPDQNPFSGLLPPTIQMPDPNALVIINTLAFYLGRSVELTDKERTEIAAIVLKGLKRSVQAQLDEVSSLLPKRRRKAKAAPKPEIAPEGEPIAKRKRGRPRKVQP